MTPADEQRLRERLKLATPRPWTHGRPIAGVPRFVIGECCGWYLYPATNEVTHGTRAEDDAALIAAAVNALPSLLDELDHYRGAVGSAFAAAGIRPGDDLYLSDAIARLVAAVRDREAKELEALDELDRLRARVGEMETLFAPALADHAGVLEVLVDYAEDRHGEDPDPGGCEVCMAVQRARAVITEAG